MHSNLKLFAIISLVAIFLSLGTAKAVTFTNPGFENPVVYGDFGKCWDTKNWCVQAAPYFSYFDRIEVPLTGTWSLRAYNCGHGSNYECFLILPFDTPIQVNKTYKLSFWMKRTTDLNGTIDFYISNKDAYSSFRGDCWWIDTCAFANKCSYVFLFSVNQSDLPMVNTWYKIERTFEVPEEMCYDNSGRPHLCSDMIFIRFNTELDENFYFDDFNITEAPKPLSSYYAWTNDTTCTSNYVPVGSTTACMPEPIRIPSDCQNITSYMLGKILAYPVAQCSGYTQIIVYNPFRVEENTTVTSDQCIDNQPVYHYYYNYNPGDSALGDVIGTAGVECSCWNQFQVYGRLHVECIRPLLPLTKSVSLEVIPSSGTTTTTFIFTVSTNNLNKPYNISMYYDGNWLQDIYNVFVDNKTLSYTGFPVGTHRMYVVVRDSEGWVGQSNEVQFTITPVTTTTLPPTTTTLPPTTTTLPPTTTTLPPTTTTLPVTVIYEKGLPFPPLVILLMILFILIVIVGAALGLKRK